MSDVVLMASRFGGIAAIGTTARYFAVAMGFPQGFLTEAISTITFREAGTLSRLYIRVLTNDHTSLVFRVRKNLADGNQTVTFGSSETGIKRDTTNSDTVTSGDTLSLSGVGTGGTAATVALYSFVFAPTSGQPVRYINASNTNIADPSTTYYHRFAGRSNMTSDETVHQFRVLGTGTLSKLLVSDGTNNGSGDLPFRSRINEANGTNIVTIAAAGTSGEDLTHTDNLASGDDVALSIVTDAGHVASQFAKIGAVLELTRGFQYVTTRFSTASFAAGVTQYCPIAGDLNGSTTESDTQVDAQIIQRLSKLTVFVPVNTLTASTTVRLRRNGANGNQFVTIGSGATGVFQDTTNFDLVNADDVLNYQIVAGGTGTEIFVGYVTMLSDDIRRFHLTRF